MDLAGLSSIKIESALVEAGERLRTLVLGALHGVVGVATEKSCSLHVSSCLAAEAARSWVWAKLEAEMALSSSYWVIEWTALPVGPGVVRFHVSQTSSFLYVDSILL